MQLEKELNSLEDGEVFLISAPGEKLLEVNLNVLTHLVNKGYRGVIITLNNPYSVLVKIIEKHKIDQSKLYFIDCITKTAGGQAVRNENTLFISSPANLTELGVAVSQLIAAMPKGKQFVMMDSLSTLAMYNSTGSVAKFSHFLITKIKLHEVSGVIISVEAEIDEQTKTQISSLCNKTIRLGD
ncbi:Uncharacterised protein [Candidatus Bilamarchaeum dharawalense]|uniref:KaiC n=1 Tax=Candidatus Bilamarchaeum dharawalense TaxID=2885759 RepID=A0A5E4LQW3_9ARCH|nr:Uncharacterised protein [Candidatus Bilamarchaeum dharawalense]